MAKKQNENAKRTTYEVRDGDGNLWATYCYKGMAQRVAERCNEDPTLPGRTPFMVLTVPAVQS